MKLSEYHKSLRVELLPEDVMDYAKGTSASQIAVRRGVRLNTILRRLREIQFEIRPPGTRPPIVLNLSHRFHEIVDGLMLGDGSINKDGSIRLTQCATHQEWVLEVRSLLILAGLQSDVIPVRPKSTKSKSLGRTICSSGGLTLYSQICKQTKQERLRWYPRGKKRIPEDLVITRLSVALWFCGDGAYGKNGTLRFCTQSFTTKEIKFLASRMLAIGVYACPGVSADGPILRIDRKDDAVRLMEFMRPYIHPCFEYKLRNVQKRMPCHCQKLTEEQVTWARTEYSNGVTKTELSQVLGISKQSAGRLISGKTYVKIPVAQVLT